MSMEPCKDCGGKYCMCEACQSMKKILEEISKISFEKLTDGITEHSESKEEN